MRHAAKMLAIDASFTIVPDLVLISMRLPHRQNSETLSVKCGQSFDVGKLVRVARTMNALFRGDLNTDGCLAALQDIATEPSTCGNMSIILSFACIGFTATACMFNGTWIDASVSAALGTVVGALFILANQFPVYGPVFEISSCIFVALFARVLHSYVCFDQVSLASILILLPGYGMTMAVVSVFSFKTCF